MENLGHTRMSKSQAIKIIKVCTNRQLIYCSEGDSVI